MEGRWKRNDIIMVEKVKGRSLGNVLLKKIIKVLEARPLV